MDQPLISIAASNIPPPNVVQTNYPDTLESLSPRPQPRETTHDEPLPNVPNAKLRLMCSYGGHIMPRPHDKSLFYVGGDTRIVVIDRSSSLKDLCSRLSRTILNGRPFTLKYQLPDEDLDSLITVTTDEDLENMIEEYDRIASASSTMKSSSSRLRVFLFFTKPESTLSMGSLLDDAKSETWFVDALNNSGILSRGVSDSAGDSFVNLDNVPASDSSNNLEAQGVAVVESLNLLENNNNNNNNVKNVFDVVNVVNSTPGSPMLENTPSSSSLSSSMANLPPIRVRVDETGGSRLQQENKVGMKQDDGFVVSSANVAMAAIPAASTMAPTGVVTTTVTSDVNVNRVVSDDERSDYGGVTGARKPPLPLQLVQPRTSGGLSLPSPDSVTSDNSSIASTNSFSKIIYHQEQVQVQVQPTNIDNKPQDSSYILPPQLDQNQQQQFVHSNTHYIHHPTSTNQVPISSYYQVYPPQSQQQQQLHNPIGQQQYPIYVMPIGTTLQQPYNMTLQHTISDPNVVSSIRPLIPQSGTPPIYPNKSPNPNVPSNSTFVQVPSNQFQQQYVGLPQFHHQPQHPINVAPSSGTNYGYEYGGNVEGQVYYTQQTTNVPLVTQYQSMTPAAAAAALSDASQQFPAENVQQPNRTSQPV